MQQELHPRFVKEIQGDELEHFRIERHDKTGGLRGRDGATSRNQAL